MLSTIDLDEFTRMAGLDLSPERISDLREMLHLQDTGKWRWPTWTVTDRRSDVAVVARALIGLLSCDLLIVGQGSITDQVRSDLMPTMAARPNPQIVYA